MQSVHKVLFCLERPWIQTVSISHKSFEDVSVIYNNIMDKTFVVHSLKMFCIAVKTLAVTVTDYELIFTFHKTHFFQVIRSLWHIVGLFLQNISDELIELLQFNFYCSSRVGQQSPAETH